MERCEIRRPLGLGRIVAKLNDRLPVVIAPEDRERWLSDPGPETY